jgi:hypothetical protein
MLIQSNDPHDIIGMFRDDRYEAHVAAYRQAKWLREMKAWNDDAMARVNVAAAQIILRAKARRGLAMPGPDRADAAE